MKLTIIFENKTINLSLNSPVKVKELLSELSKELSLPKNNKVCLFNLKSNSCYDEQDFISNSEDLEVFLFTVTNFKKSSSETKTTGKIEELIKKCTDAKDTIKVQKSYYKDKYEPKSFVPKGGENNFEYFKELILSHTGNGSIKSKLSELMFKEQFSLSTASTSTTKPVESETVLTNEGVNVIKSKTYEKEKKIPSNNNQEGGNKNPYMPEKVEHLEADPAKLENLLCMGFEEEKSKKALVISNNNLEHATELLLGGSDFELYDQVASNSTNVYPMPVMDMGEEFSSFHDILNQYNNPIPKETKLTSAEMKKSKI